ncbi:hypothetical protein [Pedosphaera parvula]|uniref:Uncharacterized protein n=1 Tax=Pedosphaera parvula (strain Ellin514) TaxID=320771 RepID=B9XPI9_PEDPL|nr:hypothetical protein [Pedosphaera parvula]EEF58217.1 hypothetical protein Cflav_PD1417 [Pedosphaera parvula Ellin514]
MQTKENYMETTSTLTPLWKGDCVDFARSKVPFKVTDIQTDEHQRFCRALTASYEYRFEIEDETTGKFIPVRPE